MPDKHINELPTKTQEELDTAETLWIVGDPDTGTLYQVTIAQLKLLVTPEDNWKTVLSVAFGLAGAIAANSVFYGQITGRQGVFGAESTSVFIMSEDCTAKNFYIKTSSTQPATGDLVVIVRKNLADTIFKITIPAGSTANTFSNLVDTLSLVAGDIICYQLDNQANAPSCLIYSLGFSLVKIS